MAQKITREELLAKAKKPAADAMIMHEYYRGKMQTVPRAVIRDINDFAIWYTPGVAAPCKAIQADRDKAYISRPEHDALADKVAACLTRSEVLALVATIVAVVGILIEVLNFAMFQHK